MAGPQPQQGDLARVVWGQAYVGRSACIYQVSCGHHAPGLVQCRGTGGNLARVISVQVVAVVVVGNSCPACVTPYGLGFSNWVGP